MTDWKEAIGDLVNPEITYYVFDDFPWERVVGFYKQFMGCQKEFTVTDRYFKKATVRNPLPRPSIFLFNKLPTDAEKAKLDWGWIVSNCELLFVMARMYE